MRYQLVSVKVFLIFVVQEIYEVYCTSRFLHMQSSSEHPICGPLSLPRLIVESSWKSLAVDNFL